MFTEYFKVMFRNDWQYNMSMVLEIDAACQTLHQMPSKPHYLRLCSAIEAIKGSVVEWQFVCHIIDLQITKM